MTSLFRCIFGSSKTAAIDTKKTLYANFDRICRLHIFNPRSKETRQVHDLLKLCSLHSTQKNCVTLTESERKQDIAVLEVARIALEYWVKARPATISHRHTSMHTLLTHVRTLQTSLVETDQRYRLQTSQNPVKQWVNPRFDENLMSNVDKDLFQRFTKFKNEIAKPQKTHADIRESKWNKLSYAVFLPIFNYALDFDCFDLIFDGFNLCLDVAKTF